MKTKVNPLDQWTVWEMNAWAFSPIALLGVFDTKAEAEAHRVECEKYAIDNKRGYGYEWPVLQSRDAMEWGVHDGWSAKAKVCSKDSACGRIYIKWRKDVGLPPIRAWNKNRAGNKEPQGWR